VIFKLVLGMAKKETTKKKKGVDLDIVKLGKRIKSLRIKQGYSNYENFAYEHDLPRAQYGRYEQGENLRYSSLMKVIRAFGMTQEEFFSEGFK
jgi:transcriptional regulator with XRE-family HTH domain